MRPVDELLEGVQEAPEAAAALEEGVELWETADAAVAVDEVVEDGSEEAVEMQLHLRDLEPSEGVGACLEEVARAERHRRRPQWLRKRV